MSNEQGKRYVCESCGGQVVVTKGGEGTIMCCSKPMTKNVPEAANR